MGADVVDPLPEPHELIVVAVASDHVRIELEDRALEKAQWPYLDEVKASLEQKVEEFLKLWLSLIKGSERRLKFKAEYAVKE